MKTLTKEQEENLLYFVCDEVYSKEFISQDDIKQINETIANSVSQDFIVLEIKKSEGYDYVFDDRPCFTTVIYVNTGKHGIYQAIYHDLYMNGNNFEYKQTTQTWEQIKRSLQIYTNIESAYNNLQKALLIFKW